LQGHGTYRLPDAAHNAAWDEREEDERDDEDEGKPVVHTLWEVVALARLVVKLRLNFPFEPQTALCTCTKLVSKSLVELDSLKRDHVIDKYSGVGHRDRWVRQHPRPVFANLCSRLHTLFVEYGTVAALIFEPFGVIFCGEKT
jgi:hypothetical protein